MAKLILKAPYYKRGHKTEDGRGRGGYAEYIATREGVELFRGGMVNYIGQRKGSCGLFSDEGVTRSEEGRGGEEGRSRGSPDH